jgi:hypothetical protein
MWKTLLRRLFMAILLLGLSGCNAISSMVFVTMLVATEPYRAHKWAEENPKFLLEGRVVDEAGRPVDHAQLRIVTESSSKQAWGMARWNTHIEDRVMTGGAFRVEKRGQRVTLWFGADGRVDRFVQVLKDDEFHPVAPEITAASSTNTSRAVIDRHVARKRRDLIIVLPRESPVRLSRYEGELEYRPGLGATGATINPGTGILSFGQSIPLQSDGGASNQIYLTPQAGNEKRLVLWFPGPVVVQKPGTLSLKLMTMAPMLAAVVPFLIERTGGESQVIGLDDEGLQETADGDHELLFYFQIVPPRARHDVDPHPVPVRYGKALLTLHPPSPSDPSTVRATIRLHIREDGSRYLAEPAASAGVDH